MKPTIPSIHSTEQRWDAVALGSEAEYVSQELKEQDSVSCFVLKASGSWEES